MPSNVSVLGFPGLNLVDSNAFQYGPKGDMAPSTALEEQAINRKQQIANLLIQRGLGPLPSGQMAGRFFVPTSPVQGVAQLASVLAGLYGTHRMDESRKDLAQQDNDLVLKAMEAYKQKTAPQEVETKPADIRQVNGSGVESGLPFGIDPNVMPSQGFDPSSYQWGQDPTQQVQANKNAIALSTPPPQAPPPQQLAGVPQQMNPWTMELVGQPNLPPEAAAPVDPLQQRFDRGEQYTRQPFQQPPSQVTISPSQTQMMGPTPDAKRQAIIELMANTHPRVAGMGQLLAKQEQDAAERANQREFMQQEKALDRDVRVQGIEENKNLRIEQMRQNANLLEMNIQAREAAGMRADDLKKELARQNADLQKTLHGMDIQGRKDIAQITADTKKELKNLSPTVQKEIFETDDSLAAGQGVIKALDQALAINDQAYEGFAADKRAAVASNIPGMGKEGANATVDLENIITNQALGQLKATFGGMPTEGERKVLLEVQGSVNMTAPQRKAVWERAKEAVQRRNEMNMRKAEQLRSGTFFDQGGGMSGAAPSAPTAQPSSGQPSLDDLLNKYK
jgi:hypothetical protein